ncbi:heme biosynthesis protein HemY [Acuticoccus mangrovi]|uniref:Heme biosynthesis protein HemY n=1 Tax=Acuticoccus mangrovi TaxID=2796142 RepID=A0A934MHE2_9HYPH|nr:heme biosynthesis HemY N-terminal domain-containing protein [Acuticoccus mangrovi]MBJ3776860.1 heme biosynthesis protein HemY [Acuticoccus mangrovi]
MIRVLVILGLLFAAAFGAVWVADRPGEVQVEWLGRSGTLTTSEALTVLIILLAVGVLLVELALAGLRLPKQMARRAEERRRERGFAALSEGLVAAAAGDRATAERAAAEAVRWLPGAPLTALLAARAAQLSDKPGAAEAAFMAMTEDPATLVLGLRGLYDEAVRQGDVAAARAHARAANLAAPALPWAAAAAFDAATAERDWDTALELNDAAMRHRLVERAVHKRRKAVLLLARAEEVAAEDPQAARRAAIKAHNLARNLVPAAVLAARLSAGRSRRQAMGFLEATWKLAPHPDLFAAYLAAGEAQSAADRLKRAEALAAMRPDHVESALGVAAAARAARAFARARAVLAPIAEARPTQRVAIAMAEVEAADAGDEGRVREWLARAVRATRDPVWIADGVIADHWEPISPLTGRLDRFEWRVPDGVADAAAPAIDLTALTPVRLASVAAAALPEPPAEAVLTAAGTTTPEAPANAETTAPPTPAPPQPATAASPAPEEAAAPTAMPRPSVPGARSVPSS